MRQGTGGRAVFVMWVVASGKTLIGCENVYGVLDPLICGAGNSHSLFSELLGVAHAPSGHAFILAARVVRA